MKESDKTERTVRPFVKFTPDEYRLVSIKAAEQSLEKGEYLRKAVLYCVKNGIDLTKK